MKTPQMPVMAIAATVRKVQNVITSWTDRLPEQNHIDAPTSLKSDGRSGLSATISPSSQPRTVVLHAGASDLRPALSISGEGIAASQTLLGPASQLPQGLVITVSLPATSGPTQLQLGGSADGPAPEVYLAAVTVRLRT
jgi:hypothetical protein